jgi:hypothetical protein
VSRQKLELLVKSRKVFSLQALTLQRAAPCIENRQISRAFPGVSLVSFSQIGPDVTPNLAQRSRDEACRIIRIRLLLLSDVLNEGAYLFQL